MLYLLLSILSSTGIFIIFRISSSRQLNIFNIIIINYLVAALTGFILSQTPGGRANIQSWIWLAFLIGILFIIMFFMIAASTEKAGVAVTSIASKMSVVIPISFSIAYDPGDNLTLLKATGIGIAMVAVFLTVYKKRKKRFTNEYFLLPLVLFMGLGIVDLFIKLAQYTAVSDTRLPFFSTILFSVSFLCGFLVKLTRKGGLSDLFHVPTLFMGSLLGLCNYGSIYFIIRSLNYKTSIFETLDGSVVFGINNLGIVVLSVLVGYLGFKESFTPLNWTGVGLSLISITLLAKAI